MKKWLVLCGICAALLAAAAVYVFRPVRLDTSGAVSAQLHIVHNYGWELKYDGDLIPHIYSYNYTLESGSEEFDALIELLTRRRITSRSRLTSRSTTPAASASARRTCAGDA